MKEHQIKTATEAKDLADKKKLTLDQILDSISMAAEGGNYFTIIYQPIPLEVSDKLLKSGFKLSYIEGQMREQMTKIEW